MLWRIPSAFKLRRDNPVKAPSEFRRVGIFERKRAVSILDNCADRFPIHQVRGRLNQTDRAGRRGELQSNMAVALRLYTVNRSRPLLMVADDPVQSVDNL